MNELILILGMMAVTVVVRYPVLALVGRFNMPTSIYQGLKYVPVAVLTAISVPEIVTPGGELNLSYTNAHLVAGVVAIVTAWWSQSLLLTIVLGMSVFFAWKFFMVM